MWVVWVGMLADLCRGSFWLNDPVAINFRTLGVILSLKLRELDKRGIGKSLSQMFTQPSKTVAY